MTHEIDAVFEHVFGAYNALKKPQDSSPAWNYVRHVSDAYLKEIGRHNLRLMDDIIDAREMIRYGDDKGALKLLDRAIVVPLARLALDTTDAHHESVFYIKLQIIVTIGERYEGL